MEKENEIIEQAEEIITEMCLDAANAVEEEQPDEDYGEQIMRLTAQVEALEAENRQLRQSMELLQSLPRFSAKTRSSSDGFSAIREIFRKNN